MRVATISGRLTRVMSRDILAEIRADLCKERPTRLTFTRRAFRALPRLRLPTILDLGCGTGWPTLELATLCDGRVLAVDIDPVALAELARRTEEAGLSERVAIVRGSMLEMPFADGSSDVIWSEGSVFVIGFSAALRQWRRFIRPGGFLVIHEMIWLRPGPPDEVARAWLARYPGLRTASRHAEDIRQHGYEPIASFQLPKDTWWVDYYEPLAKRVRELRAGSSGDPALGRVLAEQEREIDLFKRSADWVGSGFFIMRKEGVHPVPGNV